MADHLRKLETMYVLSSDSSAAPALTVYVVDRFTLTPQRMRIIVEAFKETLELGLSKPGQVVVSLRALWQSAL